MPGMSMPATRTIPLIALSLGLALVCLICSGCTLAHVAPGASPGISILAASSAVAADDAHALRMRERIAGTPDGYATPVLGHGPYALIG
jgi:hypothetical protein